MAQFDDDRSREVETAIRLRVEEAAPDWFPGVGPRPAVRLRRLVERPRAVLYAVHLDGGPQPHVLAKVRRSRPADRVGKPGPDARPRLATGPLGAAELTALEFAGLRSIEQAFGSDPRFAVVRPLDHLVGHDTVLIEYVDAPTLRHLVLRTSRLFAPPWRARPPGTGHACRLAGAWLGRFQREVPHDGRPERQPTRESVVDAFLGYEKFLATRLDPRAIGDVALRGGELAARLLPDRLPMAVGHGDYAPRNMFAREDGRLAVFDPLPRWLVPQFDDLSRLLVAIRLQAVQVHTRGLAFSRDELDRHERDVLAGYRDEQQLSLPELRCYQLLVTLDRWCALLDGPATGRRGRLRIASVRRASGYLRAESERLLRAGSDASTT